MKDAQDSTLAVRDFLDPLDRERGIAVVCGAIDPSKGDPCRQQLAVIVTGGETPYLFMPNGWRADSNGTWRVSAHAMSRFARGTKTPRNRRPDSGLSREEGRPVFPLAPPMTWPFAAVCPQCGQVRTFEAAALGVDPGTMPEEFGVPFAY